MAGREGNNVIVIERLDDEAPGTAYYEVRHGRTTVSSIERDPLTGAWHSYDWDDPPGAELAEHPTAALAMADAIAVALDMEGRP